jgi:Cu+-exporting ATPase
MDSLISVAVLSSLAYSLRGLLWNGQQHLYFDVAASLICFRLLGNLLEQAVFRKATEATDAVRRLLPRKALRCDEGGYSHWISVEDLQIGDRIRIAPGDRVPVDGRVLDPIATVSTAIIDGEPHPREVFQGDFVPGGSNNGATQLHLEVVSLPESSLLTRIADHVKEAALASDQTPGVTDALARILLPVVFVLALATWAAGLRLGLPFSVAFERALAVLVVSCPCALAIAAPMARIVTASSLARAGIVVRGQGALDDAATSQCIAFDKTGTLTQGEMSLESVLSLSLEQEHAIALLAALEAPTGHPIALAMAREVPREEVLTATTVRVEVGKGITGEVEGRRIQAGSPEWIESTAGEFPTRISEAIKTYSHQGATPVLLWASPVPGNPSPGWAVFSFQDALRPEALEVRSKLKNLGLEVVLLSGDCQTTCDVVATTLTLNLAKGRLSPEQKAHWLHTKEKTASFRPLFVGDGINDAPALAAAVGVAVSNGTDFARETASVLLLEANLELLPRLIQASRKMRATIRRSLWWATGYNLVAVPLAMAGWLNPILAAAAMIASSILVSVNALRLRGAAFPSS